MTVGQRIKARRRELDINADFLAERIGVSRATIFRYENGDIEKVPGDTLVNIAKVLHTTPAYLMGWEDDEETKKEQTAYSDLPQKRQALIDFALSVPDDKAEMILRVMKSILEDGK